MLVLIYWYPTRVNLYWQRPKTKVNNQLRNDQHRKTRLCLKTVFLQVPSGPGWTLVKWHPQVLLPSAHPFQVPLCFIVKLHQSLLAPDCWCQNNLQKHSGKQLKITVKQWNCIQSSVKLIIREGNSKHSKRRYFQS